MGKYFNPANEASIRKAGGKRLRLAGHDALVSQLQEGESLGIHLDRFMFEQVADVTDKNEFYEFYSQVENGSVLLLGFYALPSGEFR